MVRLYRFLPSGAALLLLACGARTELDVDAAGWTASHSTAGHTPQAICPADIETTPLTPVALVGSALHEGPIVAWHWELLSRPEGSSCAPPAPADASVASFTADLAGEYSVRFSVTAADGESDSCDVVVRARTAEAFRVEMFWNPPEDPADPTDVDLHLLHPTAPAWFDLLGDCYYSNCQAASAMVLDWDVSGYAGDDPSLDIDDVDGYGPENINLSDPVVGHRYTVGVHYFDDEGWGPAEIYVKVYCGTSTLDPIYEVGPLALSVGPDTALNEFWKVAHVTWDGQACAIEPIGEVVTTEQARLSP